MNYRIIIIMNFALVRFLNSSKERKARLRTRYFQTTDHQTTKDRTRVKQAIDYVLRAPVCRDHKPTRRIELPSLVRQRSFTVFKSQYSDSTEDSPIRIIREFKNSRRLLRQPIRICSHSIKPKSFQDSSLNTSFADGIIKDYMNNL